MKLLLVEDNEQEIATFKATVKRYQREKNRLIELVETTNASDSFKVLDNSFDGALIDLKLGQSGYEGNDIIEKIASTYRIPVAILTGHPRNAITGISLLRIYVRGETGYDEILDFFFQVYDTGLTKIFGGRGYIEEAMRRIFWRNILPRFSSWQKHVANGQTTEKALLRFTVSQLFELLDDDESYFYPEEMYIIPPLSENFRTGSIVKLKELSTWYVILSPACDLVLRADGKPKTDSILACQIESLSETGLNKSVLTGVVKNSHTPYYHYLPPTEQFPPSLINFRKVETFPVLDFSANFEKPFAQISMAFVKDIVARFSSYYSRQGQPDFDFNQLVRDLAE